jgi:AcrR family transcriptional regulator
MRVTDTGEPNHATRQRILDTAERLFAQQGLEAASLRTITAQARVNLAAVHYHFGSKEALIHAVFARVIGPVNDSRVRRLDELEAAATPPSIEDLLEAFLAPAFGLYEERDGRHNIARQLLGRLYTDPGEARVVLAQFGEVIRRFRAAFRRALPELAPVDLLWRLHFMTGAMAHTLAGSGHLQALAGEEADLGGTDEVLRRLIAFIAAGLRAPRHSPAAAARA